ncbi:MAG: hypothetical protein Q4F00_05625 [bacterium]|nr:hypothetical protein [bacterium]
MSRTQREAKIESTLHLLELDDEQKIKCAVRAISGEPVRALALEYGVGEDVIQAWVDRVGDMVEENELDGNADLEKQIAAAKAVCYRLQKQIEAERKQVEKREIELRMLLERPPFMQG